MSRWPTAGRGLAAASALAGLLIAGPGCPTQTQWLITPNDGGDSDASGGDGSTTCNAPLQLCEEVCRDSDNDNLYCGDCETACEGDQQCVGGSCVCRPGLQPCGEECVDVSTDPSHCGGCGNDCTVTAEPFCNDGDCSATPCEDQVPATTACGEQELGCVSDATLQTSPLHCGECDNECDANELCVAGSCASYYPAAGCTACPCADVCGTNLCCTLPGAAVLICLVGATGCP